MIDVMGRGESNDHLGGGGAAALFSRAQRRMTRRLTEEERDQLASAIAARPPKECWSALRKAAAMRLTEEDQRLLLRRLHDRIDLASTYRSSQPWREIELGAFAEDWEIIRDWVRSTPQPDNPHAVFDEDFLPTLMRLWRVRIDHDPDDKQRLEWVGRTCGALADPEKQTALRLFAAREIMSGENPRLRERLVGAFTDGALSPGDDGRTPQRILLLLDTYFDLRSIWATKVVASFEGTDKTLHLVDPDGEGRALCGLEGGLERAARGSWASQAQRRCLRCERANPYDAGDPDLRPDDAWSDEDAESKHQIYSVAARSAAEEDLEALKEIEAEKADDKTITGLSEAAGRARLAVQGEWARAVAIDYATRLRKRHDDPRQAWRALQASPRVLRDFGDRLPKPTEELTIPVLVAALLPLPSSDRLAFELRRVADNTIEAACRRRPPRRSAR